MKTRSVALMTFGWLLALPLAAGNVAAQSAAPVPPAQGAPPPARPSLVTVQQEPLANAGLVSEVEKMVQARADAEVIKAFITSWSGRFYVTADQILHLHDIGASTDLLTTLIHRSGELQAQAAATAASAPSAPSLVTPNPPDANANGTNPPALIYPYVSPYPAYTYSYIYPSIWPDYSYWSVPYSYSYYSSWPYYRYYGYYGWGYRPWYRHTYPVYSQGWRNPGYYGHGGYGGSRGFGHVGTPYGGHGGFSGGRPGFSYGGGGGGGGHGRR